MLHLSLPAYSCSGPWEAQHAVPKETRLPLTDCQYVAGLKGNTEDNAWHASVHPLLCMWAHKEAGLGAHELMPLNLDRMMIFPASNDARTLCLSAVQLSARQKRITERSHYVSLMFYTVSQPFLRVVARLSLMRLKCRICIFYIQISPIMYAWGLKGIHPL